MSFSSIAASAQTPDSGESALERRVRLLEAEVSEDRRELKQLRTQVPDDTLAATRAGQSEPLPQTPVGERPAPPVVAEVTALPETASVLAAPGDIIVTPSVEYTRSSSNRLVFRGVEIVPGIQLGLIDANQVASDTSAGALDLRTGILPGFEAELRVPYYYRHNSLTTVSQQVTSGTAPNTQTQNLEGLGLGDVEFLGRYQINHPVGEEPIYIASMRVKSPSGQGPFSVNFDSAGIATELPTGTGFWGAGPGITVIIPSDPVVLFGSLGYLHNFSADIDKTIGTTPVGEVTPGDSVDISMGFGLALNPRFSFSLGYAHSMIFPSVTMLGTTKQTSNTIQAGSLTMGFSYQFSRRFTLNENFQFGVTSDAPNLVLVTRIPFNL